MTIRFLISPRFIYYSLISACIFTYSDSAVAINRAGSLDVEIISLVEPYSSQSTFTSHGLQEPRLVGLRIPFFSRKKDQKSKVNIVSPPRREYIFRAPETATKNLQKTYQVQVYGSDRYILEKVQAIEPKAFLKGNLIQVGVFSQPENAEDLLQKLAMAGFWARIIVSE